MKYYILSVLLLPGLVGCGGKSEDAIPADTLQLTVQGKRISFPANVATITLSNRNSQWYLAAQATDAAKTTILIGVSSGGASLEATGSYSGSGGGSAYGNASSMYGCLVLANFRNSCGVDIYQNDYITYYTGVIPAALTTTLPDFTLTIKQVNTGSHTMSGTFAGTYWKGCDKLKITDGQFNLPYTVKP